MAKTTKKDEYATPDVDAKHLKLAEHIIQANGEVGKTSHLLARIMALEEKVNPSKKTETTATKPSVVK